MFFFCVCVCLSQGLSFHHPGLAFPLALLATYLGSHLGSQHLFPPLSHLRRPIPANRKLIQILGLVNHQALLVGQMQQTDEAVRRGYVLHGRFGVHGLQPVHDLSEVERGVIFCGGWFGPLV